MSERTERRSAPRRDVALPSRLRASTFRLDVTITDLSQSGCCILSSRHLPFRSFQWLTVQPEGLDSFTAIVRWIDGKKAGIAFDRRLYGPILDHLALLHEPQAMVTSEND